MTSLFLLCILTLLSIISLYLVKQINNNQQDLIKTEETRIEIEALLKFESLPTPDPVMRISIEITDPIGLAHKEQPFTKYLSQLTPTLIIKKVYEQVADEVKAGLQERHVNSVINIETR